jgi:hypothetical protein
MEPALGIRELFTGILPDHAGGTRAVFITADSRFKKTEASNDITPLIVKTFGEMPKVMQGHGVDDILTGIQICVRSGDADNLQVKQRIANVWRRL